MDGQFVVSLVLSFISIAISVAILIMCIVLYRHRSEFVPVMPNGWTRYREETTQLPSGEPIQRVPSMPTSQPQRSTPLPETGTLVRAYFNKDEEQLRQCCFPTGQWPSVEPRTEHLKKLWLRKCLLDPMQ